MESKKKIMTIIALVFEFISLIAYLILVWFFSNIESLFLLREEFDDISDEEYTIMIDTFQVISTVLLVFLIITILAFLVNIILFTRLMTGKYSEEAARKVYLYQAIWGGISLLSNQVTGILYLISGISGYKKEEEERDIREGI